MKLGGILTETIVSKLAQFISITTCHRDAKILIYFYIDEI